MKLGKDLLVKSIKHGMGKSKGFNSKIILSDKKLKLNETEKKTTGIYLKNAYKNRIQYHQAGYPNLETIYLLINERPPSQWNDEKCVYIINLDSKFKYIDYLELKAAREGAEQANKNATIAIRIAIATLALSIIFLILEIIYGN